ncbi:MAG: putative Glycerol-3-phosphate transporter [Pedosphaera sp.]|nr:putative Glycerol-3-phosphate transporter [Pedosphaera sp.]
MQFTNQNESGAARLSAVPAGSEAVFVPPEKEAVERAPHSTFRAATLLGCIILGYIGIYLCRKNISVAVPLIQKAFGVNKAHTGAIASAATVAYMAGKIIFGPLIDRFGGRVCLLLSLFGVALFGGLGALATSVPMLTIFYTANRFSGSAGWGAMVKQVPNWFPTRRLPLALAFLSMSYAFGGVFALLLAGQIARWSGDSWRAVMGLPSLVLLAILALCWLVLPKDNPTQVSTKAAVSRKTPYAKIAEVARIPQFWVVCGLSFVLTITRDFFNDWTVDFFKTSGGGAMTTQIAAFLSTPFDAFGAVGILFLGAALNYLGHKGRTRLLVVMLVALGALIYSLPALVHQPLWMASAVIGLIGFLSYGPYSLLAGVLAVEIRGKDYVATVAGFVDASGYLAGALAGYPFGLLLDYGGYRLGFHALAITTLLAVVLCLFLYGKQTRATTEEATH